MNRNRAEVSTRWSAAGAAAVYNLRLPPKASGEDTGAGPAPGFMRLTPDSRAPAKADPSARAGVVVVVWWWWLLLSLSSLLLLSWSSCFVFFVVVIVVVVVGRCWPYVGAGLPLS